MLQVKAMCVQMTAVSERFGEGLWSETASPLRGVIGSVLDQACISKPGRPTRHAVVRELKLIELLTANERQYDLDTLSRTMRAIDEVIMHDNFSGLNRILKKLDLSELEPIAFLTLLRTTKPYRQHLSEWNVIRDRAQRIAKRKGLPVQTLMKDL